MSLLTQKAIVQTTIELAEKRPLNKITVRDIVEACGITRNTFYYYFHDIYEVLESAIEVEFAKIKETCKGDYENALFSLIELGGIYKKVWLNLYKTVGHERFSAYMGKQVHDIVLDCLHRGGATDGVSNSDLELICAFYEEALQGIMIRWLKEEKNPRTPEEVRQIVERVRVIFDGQLPLLLKNCRQNLISKP